jgi:hypothetical protein
MVAVQEVAHAFRGCGKSPVLEITPIAFGKLRAKTRWNESQGHIWTFGIRQETAKYRNSHFFRRLFPRAAFTIA